MIPPRRRSLALLLGLLALSTGSLAPGRPGSETYVCPPCGAPCHFLETPGPGACGVCGMALVPLASVPQIGVLVLERTSLPSALAPLEVFSAANVGRAFTVSDTLDPVRLSDTLELRPQFAVGEAPALDVLVLPDAYGAWEDELIVEWVRRAAEKARCVIAVGTGNVLLAQALNLQGEEVPARGHLLQQGTKIAPGLRFVPEPAWRRSGRLFLARDADGLLDASLGALAELAGTESAREAAEVLGHAWEAPEEHGGGRPEPR